MIGMQIPLLLKKHKFLNCFVLRAMILFRRIVIVTFLSRQLWPGVSSSVEDPVCLAGRHSSSRHGEKTESVSACESGSVQ
jgi:hypothetical protein